MTKHLSFKMIVALIALMWLPSIIHANHIAITNVSLVDKNTVDHYVLIQFDLSWENSWRTSSAPNNWDAAWVFFKYRIPVTEGGDGLWKHAWLNNNGHTAPSGSSVDIGLLDPLTAFNTSTNPGLGAFVYRDADGSGTFTGSGLKLRWNYGDNGLTDNAAVEIEAHAIEMVYVPEGSFKVGSGGTESGSFTTAPYVSGNTTPYTVSSEGALEIGTTAGNLWGTSTSGNNSIGTAGTLSADFPKGYSPFYCMKYELSQQAYVDFLNSLTTTQATARFSDSTRFRQGIRVTDGVYSTTAKYVPACYLNWADVAAYLDWSGLRPMTELEFEKACRGTATPVAGEYVWGTTLVASLAYTLNNKDSIDESIATNYRTDRGNAMYGNTAINVKAQVRCGIFAANGSSTGRITAGATYYGIMEMAGNLWERVIPVGNANGRAFTGKHGNGLLTAAGLADVTAWPAANANGAGFRGGASGTNDTSLRTSDRVSAGAVLNYRNDRYGCRGVRSMPTDI